jgi:PAS domain S-box-containing protein
MPDLLRSNVLAAYSIELTAALFAAAVAASFRRVFPRADLATWAASWMAGTAFALLALIGNGLTLPVSQVTWLRGIARSAGLLQAVWLLRGARRLQEAPDTAWLGWAALLSPVVGIGSSLLSDRPLSAAPDIVLRVFTSALVGVAAVAAAYVVRRRVAPQGLGTRMMAAGLVLYAFLKLFTPTTLGRLGLLEGIFAAPAVYLGFSLGPIAFALGLVVSLLEDRQRALAVEHDRLRLSEEMFATLFRSSPDAVLVTKRPEPGVIVAANQGLERVFGHSAMDVIGKTTDALGLWRSGAQLGRGAAGQPTRYRDVEAEGVHKSGRRLALSVSAEEIEIVGEAHTITVIRDVTERREVQQALRRAERMAAIGSVVAAVAHEVRNPLFGISANLDAYEHLTERQQREEFIVLLRSQVERLTDLMSDLLDYGRPPALTLRAERLDGVIERAVASCARAAEQAGVSLAARVEGGPYELSLDPGRIEQVFENLLSNAVQHSPRNSTVRIRAFARDGLHSGVLCAVEDEGPGLSPEDLTRVFEPFFSRRKGGTGLGLAIVQQIVEGHGGSIEAGNRSTGGAVFTVFLPRP